MQLVECVPNFSEGRNLPVIEEIARVIGTVDGAYVLHKDIGHSANRTVMTLAGAPAAVLEAAFNAIECAARLIDMRSHVGEHPRIGATDVCPFIPLAGISMPECVALSKRLAQRVGEKLEIPVYLYANSAHLAARENLAYLRRGQYEKLAMRMTESDFKPDFGPAEFNAKSGATVIGARPILIAYNLNLDTNDLDIARSIAQTIRRQRHSYLHGSSQLIEQASNQFSVWQNCQAIAWFITEYKCCQISMNLLDYKKNSLHEVFLAVSQLASELGACVTGSEIVGMVPLSALLEAGEFALSKSNMVDKGIAGEQGLIAAAVKFLNLDQHKPFIASEKILEYRLAEVGLSAKIQA